MNDNDITPQELAEEVILMHPTAPASVLGAALNRLLDLHDAPQLNSWRHEQLVQKLGSYCNSVKARAKANSAPTVTYNGRPMTGTIAIDGRMKLWTECSPGEFIDAVLREQNVIDGRQQSNKARRAFVDLLRTREDLMAMPTLGAAIDAAGWGIADLALDDLDALG